MLRRLLGGSLGAELRLCVSEASTSWGSSTGAHTVAVQFQQSCQPQACFRRCASTTTSTSAATSATGTAPVPPAQSTHPSWLYKSLPLKPESTGMWQRAIMHRGKKGRSRLSLVPCLPACLPACLPCGNRAGRVAACLPACLVVTEPGLFSWIWTGKSSKGAGAEVAGGARKMQTWEKLYWGVGVTGLTLFLFSRLRTPPPKVDLEVSRRTHGGTLSIIMHPCMHPAQPPACMLHPCIIHASPCMHHPCIPLHAPYFTRHPCILLHAPYFTRHPAWILHAPSFTRHPLIPHGSCMHACMPCRPWKGPKRSCGRSG